MSTRHGPPKHQNKLAWIPNAGHKKNEKELGGKFRPYSEITGVCPRCKEQIEWKRRSTLALFLNKLGFLPTQHSKLLNLPTVAMRATVRYGKYKPLLEPAKCQKCTKRSVRQAYHSICSECAKDFNVCTKCCCSRDQIVEREPLEVEAEQNALKEAIKNARERDRRTLLRAMNSGKAAKPLKIGDRSREGNLFPATSIDEYAELANENDCDEEDEDDLICS